MLAKIFLCICFLVFLAGQALAGTPSVEDIHQLLLKQQKQIEEQNKRLDALEQELADQHLLVMAQQRKLLAQEERSMEQQQVVAHLKQRATDAQTELDLVQAMMASDAKSGTPAAADDRKNPYLDQAGPMTASLAPAGTVDKEPEQPFTITAGVEYLAAYSDSFAFSAIEDGDRDDPTPDQDKRGADLGYMAALEYTTVSGITWGAAVHHWHSDYDYENTHSAQFATVGATDWTMVNMVAESSAERSYADLSARGTVAGADSWRLDFRGGLRGGWYEQDIDITSKTTTHSIDGDVSIWGVGPLAGLALDWNILDSLDLVADANLAVLLGSSKSEATSRGGPVYYSRNDNEFDVLWVVDTSLGISYAVPLGHSSLAFELGLNMEYWAGVPDYPRFYDDIKDTARYDDSDVLFLGPYFNVNWSF